jgi:hypothetical protein
MEKIKVYSNKEGEKYCKLRVIIDVPVFDWYEDPEGQEVLDRLNHLSCNEIGELVLNAMKPENVVKVEDNIPPTPEMKISPIIHEKHELIVKEKKMSESELWTTFLSILKGAIRHHRTFDMFYVKTQFNDKQLKIIATELPNVSVQYDSILQKYDIFIKY